MSIYRTFGYNNGTGLDTNGFIGNTLTLDSLYVSNQSTLLGNITTSISNGWVKSNLGILTSQASINESDVSGLTSDLALKANKSGGEIFSGIVQFQSGGIALDNTALTVYDNSLTSFQKYIQITNNQIYTYNNLYTGFTINGQLDTTPKSFTGNLNIINYNQVNCIQPFNCDNLTSYSTGNIQINSNIKVSNIIPISSNVFITNPYINGVLYANTISPINGCIIINNANLINANLLNANLTNPILNNPTLNGTLSISSLVANTITCYNTLSVSGTSSFTQNINAYNSINLTISDAYLNNYQQVINGMGSSFNSTAFFGSTPNNTYSLTASGYYDKYSIGFANTQVSNLLISGAITQTGTKQNNFSSNIYSGNLIYSPSYASTGRYGTIYTNCPRLNCKAFYNYYSVSYGAWDHSYFMTATGTDISPLTLGSQGYNQLSSISYATQYNWASGSTVGSNSGYIFNFYTQLPSPDLVRVKLVFAHDYSIAISHSGIINGIQYQYNTSGSNFVAYVYVPCFQSYIQGTIFLQHTASTSWNNCYFYFQIDNLITDPNYTYIPTLY